MGAAQAAFEFSGTHWLEYSTGLFEHGMDGQVHLVFKGAGGQVRAHFDGMTTRQSLSSDRKQVFSRGLGAVGTSVVGTVTGSFSLGGGSLGGATPRPSRLRCPLERARSKLKAKGRFLNRSRGRHFPSGRPGYQGY